MAFTRSRKREGPGAARVGRNRTARSQVRALLLATQTMEVSVFLAVYALLFVTLGVPLLYAFDRKGA